MLFARTSQIVQKLQAARQSLQLPSALAKLDRFDLIILDDPSYAGRDLAETSVLFERIVERYERRSLLISADQPFSGWNNVFRDPGMTVAAIDRLVHHSAIFEMKVEKQLDRAYRPARSGIGSIMRPVSRLLKRQRSAKNGPSQSHRERLLMSEESPFCEARAIDDSSVGTAKGETGNGVICDKGHKYHYYQARYRLSQLEACRDAEQG